MNKFHSILSRREFMKAMGLSAAGASAVAISSPIFQDLDELAASDYANQGSRHPWWVKDRDFYTAAFEIDWSVFDQYDSTNNPTPQPSPTANFAQREANLRKTGIENNIAGFSLRDQALADMVTGLQTAAPWDGPAFTPASAGYTAWQGNPEDNVKMIRAALRLASADQVGAMVIDDKCLKIFDKNAVEFANIENGERVGNVYRIPQQCKYLLTYNVLQNYVQATYTLREDPDFPGKYGFPFYTGRPAVHRAYGDGRYAEWQAMRFIKNLGYKVYKAGVTANVALGIFSGLGEQGRATYMMTPRNGLMTRITNYIITDMPLAPTKPINFGGSVFCKNCMRCAEMCPSESLSDKKEPDWLGNGPGNRPGYIGWACEWQTCIDMGAPSRCGVCHSLCPFNHPNDGLIHPIIRTVVANTSMFNSFFGAMDRNMQYAKAKTEKDLLGWWNRDLYNWKADTTAGTGKYHW